MKKRIFINVLIIVVLMSLSALATWAYFGNSTQGKVEVWTASIGLEKYGFPIGFEDLLPGESRTVQIAIQNTSTVEADFYLQMLPETPIADTVNFCNPTELITLKVQELDGNGGNVVTTWYNTGICSLYNVVSSPVIAKIGNDVDPGVVVYYNVTITLKPEATSEMMGKYNKDFANLIAVQYNGPAPVGVQNMVWPDGDSNY